MEVLLTIIVSTVVSAVITEIRCRIHFDCIDDAVKETLWHMKKTCDEIKDMVKTRTHP